MKRLLFYLVMAILLAASVHGATLYLTKPNGNENLMLDSPYTITWTSSGITNPLKLVLLRNGTKVEDIVENMPANTTSHDWTVGNHMGGKATPGSGYSIRVKTMNGDFVDDSDASFTISSGPFALTAPNGGESWPRGSTRLITWNPGAATGSVRLDLYKGGTALDNIIGGITANTPAAAGKYSWRVGDRQGNTPAPEGNDYFVVIHAYTPDLRDPGNGPFTITHAMLPPPPVAPSKSLSLTNPRRGDHWYKGTGYTIKWTSAGLADAKLKLKLMEINGTTLVETIGNDIPNSGQYFWVVPMSLSDAETFYKIRIQTADNTFNDIVGPFPISKAKTPSGPPAIKVTAPGGPSQLGTGLTYAVRWTSTCGTSVNGPTDDYFSIELMNGAGSTRVRWLLENARATYDGGNPDGSHSWHWDWKIAVNETAGTYRIRVTNLTGQCPGLGEPFQLVYRQEHNEYAVIPSYQNCLYILNWCCPGYLDPTDLAVREVQGVPGLARVGFFFYKSDDHVHGISLLEHLVLRSLLRVDNNEYWYKDRGHLQEAKMTIQRQWRTSLNSAVNPCLGGVVLLSQSVPCDKGNPNIPGNEVALPAMPGAATPINTSQGNVWYVDLTQPYFVLMQGGKPDLGLMLYPAHESSPCGGDAYMCGNAECYKISLHFRFAKDIID